VIGTYSVNNDCSATMSLKTGEAFNAVVAGNGATVLFVETDAKGGAVGELDRATNACISSASGAPQSFAFNAFGAQPATGGKLSPASSAVGSVTLDGAGGFTLAEWVFTNGAVTKVTAAGTYSLNTNCSLSVTTTSSSPANSALLPVSVKGLLVSGSSGLVSI